NASDRVGERRRVARGYQETGDAVLDDLGAAPRRRRHGGKAQRHGIEEGIRHPFDDGGENEAIEALEKRGDVALLAEQPHRVPEPKIGDAPLELAAQVAVADDVDAQAGNALAKRREGIQRELVAL